MLSRTKGFKIKYRFVEQTLDVCNANTMVLKMMIMLNSYQYSLKKCKILLKLGYWQAMKLFH